MSIESADNILHVKNSTMRISRVEVGQTLSVGNIEFDTTTTLASVTSNGNNTTPHTISSSNVTTGLATTANVIVGGDLIVGGTSLVNAIYPVGTVIDRATAITDTHPNGKYKAFLAAPNQEWELVSDGQNKVLEDLSSPCNTTSLYGRATIVPVTVVQYLTQSPLDITGSVVSGYTPVTGTDRVKYSFNFQLADDNTSDPIMSMSIYFRINGGSWIEVVSSREERRSKLVKYAVIWTFVLGATTANHDDGVLTETNPTLDFKVVAEEYGSTYQVKLHQTNHWLQTHSDEFSMPTISITAIGTKSLEYKRTA